MCYNIKKNLEWFSNVLIDSKSDEFSRLIVNIDDDSLQNAEKLGRKSGL